MTNTENTMAMILAGGRGSRLGALTENNAKPAIQYAAKYKIIDFTISNCINSKIQNIGVLTQYKPNLLNKHILKTYNKIAQTNDISLSILQADDSKHARIQYMGTADAIAKNIKYIDKFSPEYLLILSGDHIYKMDYRQMIEFHKNKKSILTMGTYKIPKEKANNFGVVNIEKDYKVSGFEEKPKDPKSNHISMGIYLFNWKDLRNYLLLDLYNKESEHDFGKNIIPLILKDNINIYAYPFEGYWRDVGTIESYWQSNMDALQSANNHLINNDNWKIYCKNKQNKYTYYRPTCRINNSIIADGSYIAGEVINSIISPGVIIEKGAIVKDSIIMSACIIKENTRINKSILARGVKVETGSQIGIQSFLMDKYINRKIKTPITVIEEKAYISQTYDLELKLANKVMNI